jgi:hypothetical protein
VTSRAAAACHVHRHTLGHAEPGAAAAPAAIDALAKGLDVPVS